MHRIWWSFLASFALLAVACEKKTRPAESSSNASVTTDAGTPVLALAPPDNETILIGEVGSLSGAEAAFGVSTNNGVTLAINQANAEGGIKGRKISLKVYDDQSKPEEAANAATRLVSQDKVKVMLGEVASSNSLAMAPKAQQGQVPMISPSSTNPKVTEVGDYIFRVCFIDPFQGFVMAKFASDNLKFVKVAILKDLKSDYSLGLTEVFTRKFTEMGGKVVSTEAYSKGDTDFRAQLTAIRKEKPEAIYIPGYYSDVGVIAHQARELGLKAVLLGGDGWDSEKLFELGGKAIDGSYISNHYSADDPSPRVQKFLQDFKQAYGAVPDALTAMGYDAARVAIEAMRRAPNLTGPAIRDAIAGTKNFPGVSGTISIDEHRNAVKSSVVMEIINGRQKYVATINP